jgi:hypothetical protein
MSTKNSPGKFPEFYEQNRNLPKAQIERKNRERHFQKIMREGRTSIIIDWSKILHGLLAIAFVVKGILLFNHK